MFPQITRQKVRDAGFIESYFVPTSQRFKIAFDLKIDSVDAPAAFVFTLRGRKPGIFDSVLVWKAHMLLEQRITHDIHLHQHYDSLFIQFQSEGYLKEHAAHDCDLGYLSAIVDNIETEDVVNTWDIQSTQIQVYPNPFSDALTFGNDYPFDTWHLYDVQGRFVMSGHSNEIDGQNHLHSGLYLLRAVSGTRSHFVKVIKE